MRGARRCARAHQWFERLERREAVAGQREPVQVEQSCVLQGLQAAVGELVVAELERLELRQGRKAIQRRQAAAVEREHLEVGEFVQAGHLRGLARVEDELCDLLGRLTLDLRVYGALEIHGGRVRWESCATRRRALRERPSRQTEGGRQSERFFVGLPEWPARLPPPPRRRRARQPATPLSPAREPMMPVSLCSATFPA